MTQNRSHAVMQQRSEPNDSLDDFPTPPWGTRALFEHVLKPYCLWSNAGIDRPRCWEPAANRGYMVRGLIDYFGSEVYRTDVFDYGCYRLNCVADFLFPGITTPEGPVDWIITNPPFRLAEEFSLKAHRDCLVGSAMLVRTSFLESVGRYERLFSKCPPAIVAQFVERLPMVKGRCDPEASTATSYAWLVWPKQRRVFGGSGTIFVWIPPCRRALERRGDYQAWGT